MLDQFGRVDIRNDDRRIERRVQFFHRGNRPLGPDSHHDPVRMHQVLDGEPFAQKFRVADDIKLNGRLAVPLDRLGDLVTGFHRNGAFIDNDLVAGHSGSDISGYLFDETQIHTTIRQRRGGHGDKNDVGIFDSFSGAGREFEAPGSNVFLN